MKKSEMILNEIGETEEKYLNTKAPRKKGFIAVIAAAVILLISITVGSIMIASKANQPAETYKTETAAETVTEKVPDKTKLSENTEYIRNLTASGSKASGSGAIYGDGMDINLDITPETSVLSDGGFLHRVLVRCFRPVSSGYDDYQADILVTDGTMELYHLTYKTKIDVLCSVHSFNFDLFVPDELEYGEVHFYLNILKDSNETIDDYSSEPFGECCVNFVQKYSFIRSSPGIKVPEADRMTLLTGLNNSLHDSILWAVGQLYSINESLENDRLNNKPRYEDDLRMKPIWEKILISYRNSNEEEYNNIISEFVDSSPKVYDKYGNLKEPAVQLHDPLEDYEIELRQSGITSEAIDRHSATTKINTENTRNDPIELVTSVSGSIMWQYPVDSYTSTIINLSAKNLTVTCYEVTNIGRYFLGSSLTDEYGGYTVAFNVPGHSIIDIELEINFAGLNIEIVDPYNTAPYSLPISPHIQNVTAGDIVPDANITLIYGYFPCQLASIHQSMEMANMFMYYLDGNYMSNVQVKYPSNDDDTSFYDLVSHDINILLTDCYYWDILQHEYGHYVAHTFNLIGDYTGISYHAGFEDLSKNIEYENGPEYGKVKGIKMAWSEGFATFFFVKLQQCMNASSLGIPNVGNMRYDSNNYASFGIHFNIETMLTEVGSDICKKCEANEFTVAGILLDFVDPIDSDDNDYICFNLSDVWQWMKTNQSKYLGSFISYFENVSSCTNSQKTALGYTLEWFDISAYDLMSLVINNIAHITWKIPDSVDSNTPMMYSLRFYDLSYNYIDQTSLVNTNSMFVPSNVWSNVCNGRTYAYAVIVTYNYDDFYLTGPYYSHPYLIALS